MSKTVLRGCWPGQPAPTQFIMKRIKENYVPPDRHKNIRGTSQYMPFIEYLMSGTPGTLAVECVDQKAAKWLGHALSRHLRRLGLYDKLRPRLRKDGEACFKVWVVEVDAKA